jgi:hypothetical protein
MGRLLRRAGVLTRPEYIRELNSAVAAQLIPALAHYFR